MKGFELIHSEVKVSVSFKSDWIHGNAFRAVNPSPIRAVGTVDGMESQKNGVPRIVTNAIRLHLHCQLPHAREKLVRFYQCQEIFKLSEKIVLF